MTAESVAAPAPTAPLAEFAAAFDEWLTAHDDEVRPLLDVGADFDLRVDAARGLRKLLWDAEWGRYGWPEDLVGAALYLASPAASFMTGQTLLIDGGFSLP